MAFETVAGSKLYVSTALPATDDAAGYAALSWTAVGEITQVPSVLGRTYNTTTHAPVDKELEVERKGSYKLGQAAFQCAWDEDDAGQIKIDAASRTHSILAFKYEKQGGALRYFQAQVMNFVENNGGANDVVKGEFTLLRQTDTVKVAAP